LVAALLRDPSAILARNVAADAQLLSAQGRGAGRGASHVLHTTSIIAAPIRLDQALFGMIHLYSREAEPELTPDDLEVTLAIAEVLAVSIRNLLRATTLESKLRTSHERINELEQQLGHGEWVGPSATMKQVREQIARVAPTPATVLIRGESGTGKELVARAIHEGSPRAAGPFIAINCAALTPTLLESELFGHEKGAFTGATERKLGKFELAHTGTLMLDELGEMSPEIQAKFLRVLEAKVFERVGGNKPIHVDVRVIAATNRDLEQAVKEGAFRSDLYFRLRVIELKIPSLRDRPEDIVPLATHFLHQFRQRTGHGPQMFSPRAIAAMKVYHWPGNVRELKNSVERAHVLATGEYAEPEDLALSYIQVPGTPETKQPPIAPYRERSLDEVEREHIEATLEHTGGQKNRAASILGIERSTLDRKLKKMLGPNP
jgi:Nif-specific regulatory protein